jgi:hypothetical protein
LGPELSTRAIIQHFHAHLNKTRAPKQKLMKLEEINKKPKTR